MSSTSTHLVATDVSAFLDLLNSPPSSEDLQAFFAALEEHSPPSQRSSNPWDLIEKSPDVVVNAFVNNFLAGKVGPGKGLALRNFIRANRDIVTKTGSGSVWDSMNTEDRDALVSRTAQI